MQDEILAKRFSTDTEIVPYYDLVDKDGNVVQTDVQVVLKNEVVQEGTALNKATLLSDTTAALLDAETVDEGLVSVNEPIGTIQVTGFQGYEREDSRYLRCDGSVVLADDYPELCDKLVKGAVWTNQTGTGLTQFWTACSGMGLTVVGGYNPTGGALSVSSDGETWELHQLSTNSSTQFSNALYADGLFVVSGSSGSYASTDGLTWTGITVGASTLICHEGMYIMQSGATVLTSENGFAWTSRFSATGACKPILYENGIFSFINTAGQSYYSTDGITWTTNAIGATANPAFQAAGNDMFVAVSTTGVIVYSTDGIAWTEIEHDVEFTARAVKFVGGKFFVLGNYETVMTSDDGVNWTVWNGVASNLYYCSDIAYGNGAYIVTGGTNLYRSEDGIGWESVYTSLYGPREVGFFGNYFVVSRQHGVYCSQYGESWVDSGTKYNQYSALPSYNALAGFCTMWSLNSSMCATSNWKNGNLPLVGDGRTNYYIKALNDGEVEE